MSNYQDDYQDDYRPLDPRIHDEHEDYEELYPKEDYDLQLADIITMVCRCSVILLFIISYVFVFINVARGHRLKNWRLYILVALVLFCWLAMSLYQDHIDLYFVQEVHR